MEVKKITRGLVKELSQKKGKIRGLEFLADADFVLRNSGAEALKKLEERLTELGFPIEYRKLKSMSFQPAALRILSLLVIEETLGYNEKMIKEMGIAASKRSLIVKLFVESFGPDVASFFFSKGPAIWKKYWTVGIFLPIKFDKEKGVVSAQIHNLDLHPIYCLYLEGYFVGLVQLVVGVKNAKCRETKCTFKGDDYHEFTVEWGLED